jgi:hypothetical protein
MLKGRMAAVAATTVIAALGLGAPAGAQTWAPADTATITPGSQTLTQGAQCTANFVFTDGAGDVLIGQSAHCAGTGASTDTNGCDAGSLPLGTPVEIEGADRPGTLVYSSWLTMQRVGERDAGACEGNDFALVRVDPADHDKVNPTVPFWGGPTGLTDTTSAGEKVLSYQNSSLRLGIEALRPKEGTSLGQSNGGWTHNVYTVSPGVPGDSGSGFLDGDGNAFGALSVLEVLPRAGSNGVADLSRALAYAREHEGLDARLALGTEPFSGSLLP